MTETGWVNRIVREERRPAAEAAASYGKDVLGLIGHGFSADLIRCYARVAARFARLALADSSQ